MQHTRVRVRVRVRVCVRVRVPLDHTHMKHIHSTNDAAKIRTGWAYTGAGLHTVVDSSHLWPWSFPPWCCNTLRHTATHCNTLQHTATHGNTQLLTLAIFDRDPSIPGAATHCDTLRHTATNCNTRQYAATHWARAHNIHEQTKVHTYTNDNAHTLKYGHANTHNYKSETQSSRTLTYENFTHIPTHSNTNHTHTRTRTHVHRHPHTHIHTNTQTQTRTHILAHTHTCTHAHTRTHTHAYIHAHAHTHITTCTSIYLHT